MLLPVRFFSIYKAADLGCLLINTYNGRINKSRILDNIRLKQDVLCFKFDMKIYYRTHTGKN